MKRSTRKAKHNEASSGSDTQQCCPDVIVDFVFEEGIFFICVKNIGDAPALTVTTTFDKRFSGLDGEQETSMLPLFRSIEFLAPGKEIRTLLDTSASYFRRRQPTTIRATVSFRDRLNKRYSTTITHNLSIYKDITFVHRTRSSEDERERKNY
jgi:hypothetical protein